MIKLTQIKPTGGRRIALHFSDGSWGEFDVSPFVDAGTPMTAPLADPAFFARCFIDAGALAWPNGFDLSAGSLHRRMEASGALQTPSEAAL